MQRRACGSASCIRQQLLRPGCDPRAHTHGAASRACSCAAAPDDCGDPGCEAPVHSRSGFTHAPSSSSSPALPPPAGGASGAAPPCADSPAASSSSWGAGASSLPAADALCGAAAAGLTGAARAAIGGLGAGASCAAGGGTPTPTPGRPATSPAIAARSVCCAASHAASARLSTCSGTMALEAGGGASGTRRLSSCGEAHADALLLALAGVFCAHARRRAGQHRALGALPAGSRAARAHNLLAVCFETPAWSCAGARAAGRRSDARAILERARPITLALRDQSPRLAQRVARGRARNQGVARWRAGPVHFFQTLPSNALPAEHRTGWGVSDSPQSTST